MAISEFIPTIWSTLLNKELEKQLVYGSCTNSNYEGEIKNAGDRVKINEIGDITINNYTKGATVTYQDIDDAGQFLDIDQSKYWAFQVDDIIKYQSNAELLKPAIEKAAYTIGDTIDQYIATMADQAGITANLGTSGTPIEINSANVDTYLIKVARMLDDNKVPKAGRFVVIPPWMHEDLVLANLAGLTDNNSLAANGIVGRYAGLDIKVSNNVPNTASAKYKVIAGYNGAIAYASQVQNVEHIRLQTTFADGVRGLYLYGAKVIKPDALALLYANEAAEA